MAQASRVVDVANIIHSIRLVTPMCSLSSTWFLGTMRVCPLNSISIGSSVFAGQSDMSHIDHSRKHTFRHRRS